MLVIYCTFLNETWNDCIIKFLYVPNYRPLLLIYDTYNQNKNIIMNNDIILMLTYIRMND